MVSGVVTIVFFSTVGGVELLPSLVFVVSVVVCSLLLLLPQEVRRKAAQKSSMIDRRSLIDFDFSVNKKRVGKYNKGQTGAKCSLFRLSGNF
jgi:hypothetical protein